MTGQNLVPCEYCGEIEDHHRPDCKNPVVVFVRGLPYARAPDKTIFTARVPANTFKAGDKWIFTPDGLVLDTPRNKPLRSQRIRRLQKAYARDLNIRWGIIALLVVVTVVVLSILAVNYAPS